MAAINQNYSFSNSIRNLLSPFSSFMKRPKSSAPAVPSMFSPRRPASPFNLGRQAPNMSTLSGPQYSPFRLQSTPQVLSSSTPRVGVSSLSALGMNTSAGTPSIPQSNTQGNREIEFAGQKVTIDSKGNIVSGLPQAPQGSLTGSPVVPEPTGNDQNATQGEPSAPSAPSLSPEILSALKLAETAYQNSLNISPEELSTQEDIDKLYDQARKISEARTEAVNKAADQPIMMDFITGQQASIERRALANIESKASLSEPLERKLSRLQAARTASLDSSKFALERADKAAELARGEKREAFTLSPGEVRYDAFGNVLATGPQKPADPKAPTTIETAQGIMQWDPASQTWKSTGFTKPISATAEAKAAEAADKEVAASQAAGQTLSLINSILPNYKAISGLAQKAAIPFTSASITGNQFKQLQSQLALGARQLLKGSGAISDYEAKTLQQAASLLGRNLDEPGMLKALKTVSGVIRTNQGQEVEVRVTNPSTGESINSTVSGEEIYNLASEGNIIEYL